MAPLLMIPRRTVIRWFAAAAGGVLAAPASPGRGQGPAAAHAASLSAEITGATVPSATPPSLGTYAALRLLNCRWFIDATTGRFHPADDVFAWLDWNLPERVIDRARQGLVPEIGPEQLAGLERRRHRTQYAELRLPLLPEHEIDLEAPAEAVVTVHHWGAGLGNVRPFVNRLGTDHARILLQEIDLTTGANRWGTAAEYAAGQPLIEAVDIGAWLAARDDDPAW